MSTAQQLARRPHGDTPYQGMTAAEKLHTWLAYTPGSSDMERTRRQAIRRFTRLTLDTVR